MQIFLWDTSQLSTQTAIRGSASAGSAVQSLVPGSQSACNSLVLEWLPDLQSTKEYLCIMSAHEDGSVWHQPIK